MEETKILLSEQDIPTQWYNVLADLPFPMPPVSLLALRWCPAPARTPRLDGRF